MQLTLVLPGLLDMPENALASIDAGAPALSRLIASSARPQIEDDGLLVEACRACRIERQQDWPVAPRLARAAGLDPASAYWLCAQPVTLVPSADDVRLSAVVDDLSPADAQELVAALNAHFSGDGIEFMTARGARWFIRAGSVQRLSTRPPEAALGAPLFAFLPRGDDGPRWRRFMNESQMILFEHAVNLRRMREARSPANSIWPWGGGTDQPRPTVPARIFANEPCIGELASGSGIEVSALPGGFEALAEMRHAIVWLDGSAGSDAVGALARLDRLWTEPAQRAVNARRLSLEIVVGGRARALRFQPRPATLAARVRARFSAPRGAALVLSSRGSAGL